MEILAGSCAGLEYCQLDGSVQHRPPVSLKKTSGGVSWRWHGESKRKGKILAALLLS